MNLKLLLCALGLAIAGAGTANATLITKHYAFSVETSGPISHHEGNFSYQYDTNTQEATLTRIDFSLEDYAFSLENVLFDTMPDFVFLGGKAGGLNGWGHGTNDFYLMFTEDLGFVSFYYTVLNWKSYGSGTPVVTELAAPPVPANPEPVDVSEPGTLGLIGAALAGLALTALRRRKAAA